MLGIPSLLKNALKRMSKKSVIKPNTINQTTLAGDSRKLIHPGRVQRSRQECRRGTALAAMAGMDLGDTGPKLMALVKPE
jgi:hypothetical protein